MYNDLDDRRRYDQGNRRSRYEQADDGGERHYDAGDEQQGQYAEDHHGAYAEVGHGHGRYQEDHQQYYEEEPERRSRVVPILTVVAAVLIVAIGVLAALYFLGVFDSADEPAATVSTTAEDTAVPAPPDETEVAPTVRSVTGAAAPDLPSDDTADANPDVPDAVVSIAPPAQGEPPVRSVHEAWQVRCDTPAGAQSEQCVLMQFVTAEDRENVGLTVIVLKTADQKAVIMRILAPLGVLLPSGLGLRIDDADIGKAGFVRCLPNGCVAEVILEDQLLGQLQNGKTATFIIFQTPEEGIGIPISLAGFSPGFSALP